MKNVKTYSFPVTTYINADVDFEALYNRMLIDSDINNGYDAYENFGDNLLYWLDIMHVNVSEFDDDSLLADEIWEDFRNWLVENKHIEE